MGLPKDYSHYEKTKEFSDQFGDEFTENLLENLCEAIWSEDESFGNVTILEKTKLNAINSVGTACFTHNNIEYEFEWEDGNNFGTRIIDYGTEINYKPPPQMKRVLVLDESGIPKNMLPLMRAKYKARKSEIDEMAGKMSYDLFFSPTNKISKHYNDYLEKNCLIVEWVEMKD